MSEPGSDNFRIRGFIDFAGIISFLFHFTKEDGKILKVSCEFIIGNPIGI